MPDDGNCDQKSKLANFLPWFYTVVIVLFGLYVVLSNPDNIVYNPDNPIPDNTIEEAEARQIGGFQTYPGQSAALQILGTFIAAMGALAPLIDMRIRGTSSVPLGVLIAAVVGPTLVISGQVIQGMNDNPLVLVVIGVMSVSVMLTWVLAAAVGAVKRWVWPWLKRVYLWLKSRLKSGG